MATAKGPTTHGRVSDVVEEDICTELCCEHKDEVIKYHCLNHDALGCTVCITLDHRTCERVHYIPKIAKDLLNDNTYQEINAVLQNSKCTSKYINKFASHKTALIKTSSDTAKERFRKYKRDIVKALNDIESDLENETIHINIAMSKLVVKSKRPRGTLQEILDEIDKLKVKNQNCRLYTYMVQIKSRLQSLEDQMDEVSDDLYDMKPSVMFTPNKDILDTLKESAGFGEITEEHATIVRGEHVKDIIVKTKNDKNTCLIAGSVVLENNKLILADHNNKNLKSVDIQNGHVKVYAQLSANPSDIALIDDEQLAVAFPLQRHIAFVSLAAKPSKTRFMTMNGECRGLDYRDNKLAVSYSDPEKVEVLTLQGTVLYTFPNIGNIFRGYLFNEPYCIAFGQKSNTLFVTNRKGNNVVCLRLDGTVKSTYTDPQLKEPYKIITNSNGTVYVCAATSRTVHQLTHDLKKIKVLLSRDDGLSAPYTMCYNEINSALYIGCFSDELRVYK